MSNKIILAGSVFMMLGVAIGAFGAHILKESLSAESLAVYNTGVEYHFYHALGLLAVGILAKYFDQKRMMWSAIFLSAGIILFSGSLYLLAISGVKGLGAITPLGGMSFISGWIFLIMAVVKEKPAGKK